jgi:hypothetical protein
MTNRGLLGFFIGANVAFFVAIVLDSFGPWPPGVPFFGGCLLGGVCCVGGIYLAEKTR